MKNYYIIIVTVIFFGYAKGAKAVMPPDFIINIGSQLVQVGSFILAGISLFFGGLYNLLKGRLFPLKQNKKLLFFYFVLFWVVFVGFSSVIFVPLGIKYQKFLMQKEYDEWLGDFIKNGDKGFDEWVKESKIINDNDTKSKTVTANNFFQENKEKDVVISNEEFSSGLKRDDVLVVDIREDVERDNGYLPGTKHIRFADLRDGLWRELPTDKFIYILCWSGMRGKATTEYLRSKKILAFYLEEGAYGWVNNGGDWEGNIRFLTKYSDEKFSLLFNTSQVKEQVKNGAILVDCREPSKYKDSHIRGSVNISTMATPSNRLEEVFSQIPAGSTVINICDDYVNCFDAKITAVELEKRGFNFIGRFNKPWDY